MKLIISFFALILCTSALALPVMNTKEALRLELWFHGLSESHPRAPSLKTQAPKALPVELEQALLKF